MKTSLKTKEIVAAALFGALTCVATLVIQIPSPVNGYVNLGDVFVLLSAYLLGPLWGGCAAGLGSGLADLISGYALYAPATFVIKFLMAVVSGILFKKVKKNTYLSMLLCGIPAELIMILGYFGFACLLLGEGLGAAASIPGNIAQGVIGIAVSMLLYPLLKRVYKK